MDVLFGMSVSEIWFYGGIIAMVVAVIAAIICFSVFKLSGWKINNQLEKEYGILANK